MNKKYLIGAILIAMYLITLSYVIFNSIDQQLMSNIASPLIALSAAAIIMLSLKKKSFFKQSLSMLAYLALIWGIADLIWLFEAQMLKKEPSDSILLMYLYLIPNIFLLVSALIYLFNNLKKWHTFQLIVDTLITFLMIVISLKYSLFAIYDFNEFNLHENINNIAYIITDVIALTLVVVMVISARVSKISAPMKWIVLGYLTYIFTDYFYVFASVFERYQLNEIIDSFYALSIIFFATGAASEWYKPSLIINPDVYKSPQNMGGNKRLWLLAIIPLWMFMEGLLNLEVILIILFFMTAYYTVSKHIQLAIQNESLLMSEKLINEKLEGLVEIRTNDLRKSYAALEKQAITDALGGLYNRKYIIDKMDEWIENEQKPFTLYYMDLNHFKVVNDIHGHEMGDAVLVEVSRRFTHWQNKNLFVARIGGDEFGILYLYEGQEDRETDLQICKNIHEIFSDKIVIEDYVFDIDASIGVARYPQDASEREMLIKYAELSMYQAKKSSDGKGCVFYSKSIAEANTRKNKIELLLKTIDFDEEFTLHFQPQFSLTDETLIGVEALIRWRNPELGQVSPGEFIPIAEDTGNINKIGKWVIVSAFKQISKWHEMGAHDLKMAINLSPQHFDSVNFFPFLVDTFDQYGVLPEWIDFEITENSAVSSATAMEEIFTTLSGLGVSISVDDFGTGYSSLSYIKRFDIDQLKIAKELIDNIVEDASDRVIIEAIILMCKGMGLMTIAEGVETQEQYEILKALGCDAMQGYYLSRPISVADFEKKYLCEASKPDADLSPEQNLIG